MSRYFILFWFLSYFNTLCLSMTLKYLNQLKEETIDLFYHGYDNYMKYAFPEDELRPISCKPLTRDSQNPSHIELNDVLGNYSLTLIDSLSTLAIIASSPTSAKLSNKTSLEHFQNGVQLFVELYGDGTNTLSGKGKKSKGFDLDSKVQVFETTIRGLGGLLSSHLFAIGELPINGYQPQELNVNGKRGIHWSNGFVYDGQFLRLAKDLADRLLPAFHSPTGIPYPRVNLRHGIPFYPNSPYNLKDDFCSPSDQSRSKSNSNSNSNSNSDSDSDSRTCSSKIQSKSTKNEITETCSAGAGSLVLEFTTLSRLLDDPLYENMAINAFKSIWKRKSSINLIGAGIDSESGEWVLPTITGIGAGIDSFFEYAFKSHILLSNLPLSLPLSDHFDSNPNADDVRKIHPSEEFLKIWKDSHQAIKRHVLKQDTSQHSHYIQADMFTGATRYLWIDSLSAFYPGLLTLSGQTKEAESAHLFYTTLWSKYSALPERFSILSGDIDNGIGWWGGRPEFIESSWYLYQATKDPWYIYIGEMALKDIQRRCLTKCGWSGLQDVRFNKLTDRMESFFLGETAKYLFLLFDKDHPLNKLDSPFIMTTEGHPLIIPRKSLHSNSKQKVGKKQDALSNKCYTSSCGKGYSSTSSSSSYTFSTLHSSSDSFSSDSSSSDSSNSSNSDTCPNSQGLKPLTVSHIASRNDLFHAAHLIRLQNKVESQSQSQSQNQKDSTTKSTPKQLPIDSPSNRPFFLWTMPKSFIPEYGFCKKLENLHFDLTFPNMSNDQNNPSMIMPISRSPQGLMINTLSGIRLGLVKESVVNIDIRHDQFRIHALSGVTLGRDEMIFIQRRNVINLNEGDPYFSRKRDQHSADVILDIEIESKVSDDLFENTNLTSLPLNHYQKSKVVKSIQSEKSLEPSSPGIDTDTTTTSNTVSTPPLFSSILKNIHSLLSSSDSNSHKSSNLQEPVNNNKSPQLQRHVIHASLPIGPGASIVSSIDREPTDLLDDMMESPLYWTKLYFVEHDLCEESLHNDIPRNYQVLIIKRGGCSFSEKMKNIPSYPPSSSSLQLVIIVKYPLSETKTPKQANKHLNDNKDDEDDEDNDSSNHENEGQWIQPYLDQVQFTPNGVIRVYPIPMVLLNGADDSLAKLKRAKGVAIRRKWWFESQGIKISNLIVL